MRLTEQIATYTGEKNYNRGWSMVNSYVTCTVRENVIKFVDILWMFYYSGNLDFNYASVRNLYFIVHMHKFKKKLSH